MALARCVDEIRLSRAFEFAAACTDSGQVTRRARFDPRLQSRCPAHVTQLAYESVLRRVVDRYRARCAAFLRRARHVRHCFSKTRSKTKHDATHKSRKCNDLDAEYRDRASRDTIKRNATGTHIADEHCRPHRRFHDGKSRLLVHRRGAATRRGFDVEYWGMSRNGRNTLNNPPGFCFHALDGL
jgi:hypothetical protein